MTKKQDRQYQTTARQWVNRQLNQGRHPLLVSPAGSGKTHMATDITKDRISLNKKLLVICGTEEIFDQWNVSFSENNINFGYINPEGVIGRNKDVYICMWQSLVNILIALPEKFCRQFNEIIIDECHHSASPTIEAIFEHFNNCLRFGLTATPLRMDNKPLGKYFTHMKEAIKQTEAIEKGYLCSPIIIVPEKYKSSIPSAENIEGLNINEQKSYIEDKKIIGDMIGVYSEVFNGEPVMIPCSSHAHAVEVTEMYKNEGWKVEHVHSKLNKYERKRIINAIRKKKINILTTYAVGVEGLDIKGLSGVIWLRQTMSLTIWIQMNARAARIDKGKKYYILVDPMGNSVLHGRPDIDRKWSLDTEYVPGQDVEDNGVENRICPVCGVHNDSGNSKCWICGYDFLTGLLNGEPVDKKKRRLPKFVDGDLVFLDEMEGENDSRRNFNDNNVNSIRHNESITGNSDSIATLTKLQKQEILNRDLTGIKLRSKFKEGIKWL